MIIMAAPSTSAVATPGVVGQVLEFVLGNRNRGEQHGQRAAESGMARELVDEGRHPLWICQRAGEYLFYIYF